MLAEKTKNLRVIDGQNLFYADLIGLPVLRLKSDYLAIATLGFAEIIRAIVQWDTLGPVTNGSNLLKGYPDFGHAWAYLILIAIFIGIIITTIIGIPMGQTVYTPQAFNFSVLGETFGKLSFTGLTAVDGGIVALFTAVISFALVDCFDTVGTLIGTATNAV